MKQYAVEEITEMSDTWVNFNGFSGEMCGKCGKTANVLAGGAGWMCDCGEYNNQSFSGYNLAYPNPDMGTPLRILIDGYRASKKYKDLG